MSPSESTGLSKRPLALVTGVGRPIGIGAAIASALVTDGWRVAAVGWRPYDARMPWGADGERSMGGADGERSMGGADGERSMGGADGERSGDSAGDDAPIVAFEADLADPDVPATLLRDIGNTLGPATALVLCHCESVDSDIFTTSVESFDRHFAVNARAPWLLIKAFAEQFPGPVGAGRIVAITSDHTPHNLPYGASKGALDRIVLAAAVELADFGITANVVNPGATDTGWMSPEVKAEVASNNLQPRLGMPVDCAALVRFLCSREGRWMNRQLLYSNGGLRG